jgi:fumarate reductase flavoprotein subunit
MNIQERNQRRLFESSLFRKKDADADGRVLNSEFKAIKGLYAAGNNAGCRFITVYQSPISGISIGIAVTEGYMLGERLAEL